jgi:hypothetical protein
VKKIMEPRNPSDPAGSKATERGDARRAATGPQIPERDQGSQKGGTSNRPGNANESGSSGSTRRDDAASTQDR